MRLPDSSQHLAIVGTNGSGKTQAAVWHLSMADIDKRPWVVYNSKTDESIDAIPHARFIGLDEIPIQPGVYITHPLPDQTEEVENHMWSVWEKQNIGVFVDEGHMMGRHNSAYRALLTQGRSRKNSVITLSQRPVWLDPFVLSEAQFYQVFRLNHKRDRKTVGEFVPFDLEARLPDYHSYYYDVGLNKTVTLKPVPDMDSIHATFDRRLARVRKTI